MRVLGGYAFSQTSLREKGGYAAVPTLLIVMLIVLLSQLHFLCRPGDEESRTMSKTKIKSGFHERFAVRRIVASDRLSV